MQNKTIKSIHDIKDYPDVLEIKMPKYLVTHDPDDYDPKTDPFHGYHESQFQSYHILNEVIKMLKMNTPSEVILLFINDVRHFPKKED